MIPARASRSQGRKPDPGKMPKKVAAWTAMPEMILPDSLPYGIVFDALLIIAVAGLWIVWWRNLNSLHKTKLLLAASIRQLEEASAQLKQSMEHIRTLEKEKRPENPHTPDADSSAETILMRTLRLHRDGESDEKIAKSLNIPINQVHLILKMHTAKVG